MSRTDSADDTESVEISTDLLSAAAATNDDSKSPSTSSLAASEPETSSVDDGDWPEWVFPGSDSTEVVDRVGWVAPRSVDAGTEVVASVVVDGDVLEQGLSEVDGTVSDTTYED